MLKKDVVIGGTYLAKVSGKLATVRITSKHDDSNKYLKGWQGVNTITGRDVHIKSAARLRRSI